MTQSRYAVALDACVATTRRNLARLEGFPYWTDHGRWLTEQRGRWTGGHWLGLIWMAYPRTGGAVLLEAAYAWSRRLSSYGKFVFPGCRFRPGQWTGRALWHAPGAARLLALGAAQALLDTLLDTCVPLANSDEEGLLLLQTGDPPHGNAIDVSLISGDHYVMETLFRLADPEVSAVLI